MAAAAPTTGAAAAAAAAASASDQQRGAAAARELACDHARTLARAHELWAVQPNRIESRAARVRAVCDVLCGITALAEHVLQYEPEPVTRLPLRTHSEGVYVCATTTPRDGGVDAAYMLLEPGRGWGHRTSSRSDVTVTGMAFALGSGGGSGPPALFAAYHEEESRVAYPFCPYPAVVDTTAAGSQQPPQHHPVVEAHVHAMESIVVRERALHAQLDHSLAQSNAVTAHWAQSGGGARGIDAGQPQVMPLNAYVQAEADAAAAAPATPAAAPPAPAAPPVGADHAGDAHKQITFTVAEHERACAMVVARSMRSCRRVHTALSSAMRSCVDTRTLGAQCVVDGRWLALRDTSPFVVAAAAQTTNSAEPDHPHHHHHRHRSYEHLSPSSTGPAGHAVLTRGGPVYQAFGVPLQMSHASADDDDDDDDAAVAAAAAGAWTGLGTWTQSPPLVAAVAAASTPTLAASTTMTTAKPVVAGAVSAAAGGDAVVSPLGRGVAAMAHTARAMTQHTYASHRRTASQQQQQQQLPAKWLASVPRVTDLLPPGGHTFAFGDPTTVAAPGSVQYGDALMWIGACSQDGTRLRMRRVVLPPPPRPVVAVPSAPTVSAELLEFVFVPAAALLLP